jgi:hypothetical protein
MTSINMVKLAVTFLVFPSIQCAQTASSPAYSFTLTVLSAKVLNSQTGPTTQAVGFLSDDLQKQPLQMLCDTAMSDKGPDGRPNTYPARYGLQSGWKSPKHIWIYAGEPGKLSMKEYRCTVLDKSE